MVTIKLYYFSYGIASGILKQKKESGQKIPDSISGGFIKRE
jgi:hypothetical protein